MTGQHVFFYHKEPSIQQGGERGVPKLRRAGGGSVISTERGTGLAADVLRGPFYTRCGSWMYGIVLCVFTYQGIARSSPGNETVAP